MSSLPLLNSVLSFLMTIPSIGPFLVKVLDILLAASVLVTPVVGVWRAVVALAQGLGKVFPAASGLAAQLSADDAKVEGFINGTLLPIIQDLSLISIPSNPAPVVPVAVQAKQA
jgi:hypothetical protein